MVVGEAGQGVSRLRERSGWGGVCERWFHIS